MPVRVKKVDGHQVSTPGGVKAKGTTFQKAQAQAALLRGIDHGWKPTGEKKARKYKKHGSAAFGSFMDKRRGL